MANEGIKSLSILDKDYLQWIKELSTRFRRSQVKASVRVNQVMLQFYWELGRDIVERNAENRPRRIQNQVLSGCCNHSMQFCICYGY